MHLSAAALRWPGSCFFGEAEAKKLEMQVGSISGLSAQLLALQGVAQDKYLSGDDFSFALDQASGSQGAKSITSTHASSSSSPKLSFTSTTLTAVGAVGGGRAGQAFLATAARPGRDAARQCGEARLWQQRGEFPVARPSCEPCWRSRAIGLVDRPAAVHGDNGLIAGSGNSRASSRRLLLNGS